MGYADQGPPGRRLKLPKHVKGYRVGDRHYYYFRGTKVQLPGLPWSPEFMDVHARMMAARRAPAAPANGMPRVVAGTVHAAVISYCETGIKTLGEGTRGGQRALLERFRAEHGDKRIRKLERQHVQAYISALKSPSVQRNMLRALKHFLGHCLQVGLIDVDPTEGVKKSKLARTGGFMIWTEEHVAQFEATHPIGTKAYLALALYLNLGVRISDVVRIGPKHIKDGELSDFLPQKTSTTGGHLITVPLMPKTLAAIKATPVTGTEHYLINEWGNKFAVKGFGNRMRKWCDAAGLPDCSSHGLRKLCLTRLAEQGLSAPQIAAVSGHKNLQDVQIYIEAANRKKLSRQAMAVMLETEQKASGEVSKLPSRLDKRTKK